MPPKAKPAASGDVNDGQRQKDAMMVFDSLFNVTSPVVINTTEIARQTGEKANTIAKRFSLIRGRYPALNIKTTSVAGGSDGTANASPGVAVPATPRPKKASAAKPRGQKKSAATVGDDGGNDSRDEDDGSDAQPSNSAEDGEASAAAPDSTANADVPATPKGTLTDANLADDEKSAKKRKAKAPATKVTKPRANTKRKRDDDDENSVAEPETKKTKVTSRSKKATKAKGQTKIKQEDREQEGDDEDGKQKNLPSEDAESDSGVPQRNRRAKCDQKPRVGDLALDVVKMWADKSRKAPLSKSPHKPMTDTEPVPKPIQEVKHAYVADATDEGMELEPAAAVTALPSMTEKIAEQPAEDRLETPKDGADIEAVDPSTPVNHSTPVPMPMPMPMPMSFKTKEPLNSTPVTLTLTPTPTPTPKLTDDHIDEHEELHSASEINPEIASPGNTEAEVMSFFHPIPSHQPRLPSSSSPSSNHESSDTTTTTAQHPPKQFEWLDYAHDAKSVTLAVADADPPVFPS